MKQIFTVLFVLIIGVSNMQAVITYKQLSIDIQQISKEEGVELPNPNINANDFLALTPSKIKQQTGRELSWKESIALKAAQKKFKKAKLKNRVDEMSEKSQLVAFLLCFFVGVLGVHRFYLGYVGIGIIQLLTLGGCGIWALIDLILIIAGELKTKDGQQLRTWE